MPASFMTSITKAWLDDLRTAVAFMTRIPMPHPEGSTPPNLARAQRVFPLIGAIIGAAAALAFLGLGAIGLPSLAAAALALATSAVLTGALHEDGLADVADGFGGGRDKATKLEIMRDSRIGTYGTLILLVSFVAKLSALTALPRDAVLPSLVTAHALARGILPVMAMTMPYARNDGLAATAGRPDSTIAATSIVFALIIAFLLLPWADASGVVIVATAAGVGMGLLAMRQIGGQTGDVLGGTEQVGETAILLLLAARLGQQA